MRDRQLQILISPYFIAGLLVLLLNDFILKQQLHNGVTGKLSDFAGLFIFPLFWTALFPRLKPSIYFLTAVLFIFWKSAYSQPIIEFWNSLAIYPIGRTVDYTDLSALLVLPFSFVYGRNRPKVPATKSALYIITFLSVFAFTATQYSRITSYNNEYNFQLSRKELMERISKLPLNEVLPQFWESDRLQIRFDSCIGEATITISEKENLSLVTLKEIDFQCPGGGNKQEMLNYFEKEFIEKIKVEPVEKSRQVQYIWP